MTTCQASGNWTNAVIWNANVPALGQDVIIPAGYTVTLDVASAELQSLELAGTLVFSNWATALNAGSVTVKSGGKATLPPAFLSLSNRVAVNCETFVLESGGLIEVSERGYQGRRRESGTGPGAGAEGGSGAGHGGHGLPISPEYDMGDEYGAAYAPTTPGSSGGGAYTPFGGHGGGAVRINASGTVRVDGTIRADGQTAAAGAGGGSGGSIYISCLTFEGAAGGLFSARGGGPAAGAGAGGRIAVAYDPERQAEKGVPGTLFTAQPGGGVARADSMGTLFLSDAQWVAEPFSNFDGISFVGSWATNWSSASFSPAHSIGFGESNFQLIVTGNVTVDGMKALGLPRGAGLHCQNLVLTNGGSLSVLGNLADTPASALTDEAYGALVSVTQTIQLCSGSWIYPLSAMRPYGGSRNTNVVSVLFRAHDVTIATNAGFLADRAGHPSALTRSATTWGNGTGAGSGRGFGIYGGYGASHGGLASNAPALRQYGSRYAPVYPGSGGGAGWTGSGGVGGGVVRIAAKGDFRLDGTLSANAGPNASQGLGGSGGSVFVLANTFAAGPAGFLSAIGGPGYNSAGGGGGRIAVGIGLSELERSLLTSTGTLPAGFDELETSVSFLGSATCAGSGHGGEGSLVFMERPRGMRGTIILVQ